MFNKLKQIVEKIKHFNNSVDNYKADTIIQSLPSLAYVNKAKKFLEQNKIEEAEKILQKALELPQQDARVYKYLGIIYERIGNFELAIENFQKSADLNPHDKIIWQRLGFSLLSIGKLEQAEKSFENANKIQAGVSETFTGWGMALLKQKKYSQAQEKFTQAAKINKYNFSAIFLCAVTDIKLEMYDKAEAKLSFLANVCPNESNSFEYARLKAIKDDFENAIHYAKKSLEFNPNMLPAYILLGQLYAKCSEKENCLNIFQIAENKNLITADLYLEWGKALQQFEIFDVALEKLQKAFELDSENVETLATLGFCYVIKKDFEKAEPLLNKVLEKDANNSKVKQTLGIIAYEHGEIAKAISIFQCDDENAINCYYLAKCFENQNNDIRTVDYYEAAIRLNPQYTTAYADYINYLISKGEISEAQRKLRKALKLDENNIKLLNLMFNVSYILVKDKVCEYNVKETLAVAKKIEDINPSLFEYPEQKQELINILKEI